MSTSAPSPTVLARLGGLVLAAAQTRGVDRAALCERTGFDPALLANPDARIPLAMENALWNAAAELACDPCFGLHAVTLVKAGDFDALDYAVRTAPDLLSALQRLARYNRLVHDIAAFRVIDEGTHVTLEHGFALPGHSPCRHASDFTLAALPAVAAQMCGERVGVLAVRLAHPAPLDVKPYRDAFGVLPQFGAAVSALVFDAGRLRRSLPQADPGLSRIVTAHAERLLAERAPADATTGTLTRVVRLVGERIANGPPALREIARTLHLSERSLQRQLEAEGTCYSALVEQVRHDLALRYLTDPRLALGEVAYLLGYAEPSPFHRAFKRWTGMTPAVARQRALGGR